MLELDTGRLELRLLFGELGSLAWILEETAISEGWSNQSWLWVEGFQPVSIIVG